MTWSELPLALTEQIGGILVASCLFGLLGMAVVKFYARNLPLGLSFWIPFWTFIRSTTLLTIVADAAALTHVGQEPVTGLFALVWIVFSGVMITNDLKARGISIPGLGIGGRTIIFILVLASVAVGVAVLLGGVRIPGGLTLTAPVLTREGYPNAALPRLNSDAGDLDLRPSISQRLPPLVQLGESQRSRMRRGQGQMGHRLHVLGSDILLFAA